MAINKLTAPQSTPTSVSDWQAALIELQAAWRRNELPLRIDYENDNVLKGAVFQISGELFQADADTAITGTHSLFVKITPGASTATASFVEDLTGVTWDDDYNGYYDEYGCLYVFDEGRQVHALEISSPRTLEGRIAATCRKAFGPIVASQWSAQSAASASTWQSIAWSPDLGLFAAVSIAGAVMTSPDGVTWTGRTAAAANQWQSVCWSPGLGLFCAVADSGTNNRVMTSPDGVTWTSQDTTGLNYDWYGIAWSPGLALFVVCGTGQYFMTSPDGINWTSRDTSSGNPHVSICWSPELELFCAITTTNKSIISSDGINWTLYSAVTGSWYSVCWSPELGLFCAVNSSIVDTYQVMTSPDGENWNGSALPYQDYWQSICWSPELGLFVAVNGDYSTNACIATSPDGINWTKRSEPEGNNFHSVCWSPELGLFCAVSSDGTNRVMTTLPIE
jgi:hypothetical protein